MGTLSYNPLVWGTNTSPSQYQLGGQLMPQELGSMPSYSATSAVSNSVSPTGDGGVMGFLKGLWGSAFDTKVGDTTTQGWLGPAMGVAQGLGNAYMGMKQYGLAEDALKEQQRQFNVNYEAQRKMTNSMLEDRQRSRVAANPGAYQSVGDYMQKYGV